MHPVSSRSRFAVHVQHSAAVQEILGAEMTDLLPRATVTHSCVCAGCGRKGHWGGRWHKKEVAVLRISPLDCFHNHFSVAFESRWLGKDKRWCAVLQHWIASLGSLSLKKGQKNSSKATRYNSFFDFWMKLDGDASVVIVPDAITEAVIMAHFFISWGKFQVLKRMWKQTSWQ